MVEVLAVGEALTDVVVSAGAVVEHPGGSPLNIAYGLGRLGVTVTLLTAFGQDARGEAIAAHLREAGVRIAEGSMRAGEATSSATATLRGDGSAEYAFDIGWSLPDAGGSAATAAPGIVHVGSLGAFLEPGGGAVVDLLRNLTAGAGAGDAPVVTFDPNMRPSIVTDHGAAFERFREIAGMTDVLKLSDEDAAWLYPGADLDESIGRILELGPALVAVTRGGEGAILATPRDRVVATPRRVEVVDTIGAGDSFMSALIAGLAELLDAGAPRVALRDGSAFDAATLGRLGDFAARCAAVTVSRAGANPPTRAELPE